MDNYTVYHLHSDISNLTAGTSADSITKFDQYLDMAQDLGMSAIAFSEHGSVMNWVKKKEETEKRGMKYIHANEIYLTEEIGYDEKNDKLILKRDNYHYMLIAKNHDGVKELNKLSSKTFNRQDGHFYYNPRVTFDELKATSDNIIMTSACLASPLWRLYKNDNVKFEDMVAWMESQKHRMFFEIQYHEHPEQIEFNRLLLELSKSTGVQLIAGTDTHSLNKEHAEGRKILLQAKNATYGDEDKFDLTFKSYDELVNMFEKQNAIPRNDYMEAINNTNVMADMIESFSLDRSHKYPKLYDRPIEIFKSKINKGFINRGIIYKTKEEKAIYLERIKEEYSTYEKLDTIDYMLLQTNIIEWAQSKGIYQGYGRGSVNGSLIAYLLGITEMDSIKHNLNFFRFMNPDRVSLPDIDVDFPKHRRQEVIDYVASLDNLEFAEIITYNTMQTKASIKEVGRAMKLPLSEVDEISKGIDENKEDKLRKKYKELFKYVDLFEGVIVSMGSHPSGYVVSPKNLNLEEEMSTVYTKESKYKVTAINMKEIDGLNFVKLDILGLRNMDIINGACDIAGIDRLTPDNVDVNDESVWRSMTESTMGVFQFESDSAYNYIRELLSDETLSNIKENVGNVDYITLLSMANGAIRPAGESYRDSLAKGMFNDNGHEALNELLKQNLGYLIFQEDIMRFLTEFCDHTGSEADNVRRGFAKKTGTEQFIPKIKEGFLKTMRDKYGESEDVAEEILQKFIKVIEDASDYGFSSNHSQPYSYIGYVCAYLRYYYPYEFATTLLNVFEDSADKSEKIMSYIKEKGYTVKPISFGKSESKYSYDKKENVIYKGIKSIKYMNDKVAGELLTLSKEDNYNNFLDLLIDIIEKTSLDNRQIGILIRLNFFSEFGGSKYLSKIHEKVDKRYSKKHKDKTKEARIIEIREYVAELNEDTEFSIAERIHYEKQMLGYAVSTDENYEKCFGVVLDINTKFAPLVTLYNVKTGKEYQLKVSKQKFFKDNKTATVKIGDMIKVRDMEQKQKQKMVDGKWVATDIMQLWLTSWELISRINVEEEVEI